MSPQPQTPVSSLSAGALAELPQSAHQAKRQLRQLLAQAAGYWRAAAIGYEAPDDMWKRYLPLLEACSDIIASSPLHPDEAMKLTSEKRLNKALERLAGALKIALFQGDLGELEGWFVSPAVTERRRRAGLNHYQRAKKKGTPRILVETSSRGYAAVG